MIFASVVDSLVDAFGSPPNLLGQHQDLLLYTTLLQTQTGFEKHNSQHRLDGEGCAPVHAVSDLGVPALSERVRLACSFPKPPVCMLCYV